MPDVAFSHDAGFEESQDQAQDLAVLDAPPDPSHQQVMVDVVKRNPFLMPRSTTRMMLAVTALK
jgi:hypothetical protein